MRSVIFLQRCGRTPCTGKGSQVRIVLWLPEALAVRQGSGRVRYALELRLRGNVLLDMALQPGVILGSEPVNSSFKYQGAIPGPCIKVLRVASQLGGRPSSHAHGRVLPREQTGAYSRGPACWARQ